MERKQSMSMTIDTKDQALAYLRSLPADHAVELPGPHESPASGHWNACRAVEVASDLMSAYEFAALANRWYWTAGELVAWLDVLDEDMEEATR